MLKQQSVTKVTSYTDGEKERTCDRDTPTIVRQTSQCCIGIFDTNAPYFAPVLCVTLDRMSFDAGKIICVGSGY